MTDQQRKALIAALLREREGYARHNQEDRVAAVDAELSRLGHNVKPPVKRAVKMKAPERTEL